MTATQREAALARKRRYRRAHPDRIREYHRRWRAAHPEYYRDYLRRWRAENPEKESGNTRRWREANPEQRREINRRRDARKRGNGVEPVSVAKIIARDGMICHLCEKPVARREFSLDHLVPISKGGRHAEDNVRVAHRRCNSRRGAKPLAPLSARVLVAVRA